ncbi:MAG: ComEC/Rec2 family competence protein [Planctomycetota bacterium JB042]
MADALPPLAPWLAVAAGLAAAASLRAGRGVFALPLAAFLAVGAARGFPVARPVPLPAREAASALGRVEGTVRRALLPSVGLEGAGRRLELDDATMVDGDRRRRVVGRVRVRVPDGPESLPRGSRVVARGRLFEASPPRNPGEADRRRWWRREGIAVGLDVPSAALLETIAPPGPLDPRARIDRGRVAVIERLRDALPPRTAGLAAALVLGVRGGLDPALRDAVAGTGTAHLLAISGMHLALLVGLARALLGAVFRPTAADVAAVALAIGYAAFAGAAAPVLRASVGAAVVHVGRAAGRRSGRFETVAIAATLLLLLDPAELFRPGFQLSFAAVTALVAAPARRSRGLVDRLLADPLRLSARAVIATAPLVLLHVGRIVPLGPVVTLLATPLFLGAFFGSLFVAFVGPQGGADVVLLAGARAFAGFLGAAAAIPGLEWSVPRPPSLAVAGLGAAAAAVLLPAAETAGTGRRRRVALVGLALALVVDATARRPPSSPELWLLDVGHGQVALLRTPSGRTVLLDCGARGRDDVGRRVVLPALDAIGVRSIDVAIVSHADADHLNGLADLLDAGRVRAVVSGPRLGETATVRALVRTARRSRVPWRTVRRGDRIGRVGPDLAIRVLAPDARTLASENDDSLVVAVALGPHRILFPGDVEAAGIRRLLDLEPDLASDLVVLPHHGQPEAALGPLLVRARPRLALASRAGPLADDVARQVARVGAAVRSTGDGGALRVRLRTDGNIRADRFSQ